MPRVVENGFNEKEMLFAALQVKLTTKNTEVVTKGTKGSMKFVYAYLFISASNYRSRASLRLSALVAKKSSAARRSR